MLPQPGRCYYPEDCLPSEWCKRNFSTDLSGSCEPKRPAGGLCDGSGSPACVDDAYCESSPPPDTDFTCIAKGKEGKKCDANDAVEACLPGLACRVEIDDLGSDICGQPAKEGGKCRVGQAGCEEGLYCAPEAGSGVCRSQVKVGEICNGFRCCEDGAWLPLGGGTPCVRRLGEGELCGNVIGGDNACQEGLKCNGDQRLKPNVNSPLKCVKETDLIREAGKECDINADLCDERRLLICRQRGGKPVCVYELPGGPCNPGSDLEVCLPENAPEGPVEKKCQEIIDGGKRTGEFSCQKVSVVEPTLLPSPTPPVTPTPKLECRTNRDCKSGKICRGGKCIRRKCLRWKRRVCHRHCKRCDERNGKCKGGCRRGQRCVRRRCIRRRFRFYY